MMLTITTLTLAALHAHAREAYPDECCGMVIERNAGQEAIRVTNVQNALHAQDPAQFPRTARMAYTMGPDAAPLLIAAERGELTLRAFYHSHPDHDAYFSAEDRTQALGGWDEPNYPHAVQIVMSVRDGEVGVTKGFAWDQAARDYLEVEIVVQRE